MSSGGHKYDKSSTSERILKAALDVLLDDDREPSMGAIASRAAVSRQAVYLHFRSRDELLVAAADWANDNIGLPTRIAALAGIDTGQGQLRHFAETVVWHVGKLGPAIRAMNRLVEKDSVLAQRWRSRPGRKAVVAQIVATLAQERRLRPGLAAGEAAGIISALTIPEVALSLLGSGMSEQRAAQVLHRAVEGAVC